MPIRDILADNIFYDLKRNDHIVFSLNTLGVHPKGAGYGVVNDIVDMYCADFKDTGTHNLGDIVTHEVPEHHLWLHGIVNHDPAHGWQSEGEFNKDSYLATVTALNELYEKYDDELVRPMRSLWLGRGKMRKIGETPGNILWMMQMMATSKLETVVYVLDGYEF